MTALPSGNVALVWGANGVSGSALLKAITEKSSEEWSRVIAVSRRPLQMKCEDKRVRFLTADLLASDSKIEERLRAAGGNEVTHVFHYTYVEKQDEAELIEVNTALLNTALEVSASVSDKIQVFALQTGYKYYGVASSDPKEIASVPFKEDVPRSHTQNFYFNQEDLLHDFCSDHNWHYVVTRPNFIIGVSKGNYMNLAVSIALYATIQKYLGNPLVFPGNQIAWNNVRDHSEAINNARFQLWASTNHDAFNQAFNIHNGDHPRMRDVWPKIADYFSLPLPNEPFQGESKENEQISQIKMEDFMKDKHSIWKTLAQEHQLDEDAYKFATWKFLDFALNRNVEDRGSMEKARELGWAVTVDTAQSYIDTFNHMKELNMIPQ